MLKSKLKLVFFLCACAVFVLICVNIPYGFLKNLRNGMIITGSEVSTLKGLNNAVITSEIKNVSAFNEEKDTKLKNMEVNFKLFNLFNVKNLKVNVLNNENVLLGGNSVGFNLKGKGVTVVGSNFVITKNGTENPISTSDLQVGDVVLKINGVEIESAKSIDLALQGTSSEPVEVEFLRNGKNLTTKIKPAFDVQTKQLKLGLWVKDNTMGVGTLTYVKPDNLRFGSLGHAIADANGNVFNVSGGEIYNCNVVGVKKGTRGSAGEILGLFMQGRNPQGTVDKNNNYGVYGNLNKNSNLLENKEKIALGGRASCKPGKAQILTCTSGTKINVYDVEIIKTNYQNTASDKSMVIRVTDKKLIEETGGIVQGMSGSPIVQNGKIVGAVTHVFVSDPTKGFGLYIDWMLDN